MLQSDAGKIAFALFKAVVFLAIGTMIGFFLGLAYAAHLYGTPPVVTQLQSWLAGDSLYEAPLAVDEGNLMSSPVAIIPKIGACVGFAIAASVLSTSVVLRFMASAVGNKKTEQFDETLIIKKGAREVPLPEEESLAAQEPTADRESVD